MSPLPVRPRLLAAAGALLALSVGLPWAAAARTSRVNTTVTPPTTIVGAGHPMRAIGLIALAVLVWAIRRGSWRAGWAAIGIAALALPIELDLGNPGIGRLCYLIAMIIAVLGVGLLRMPSRLS